MIFLCYSEICEVSRAACESMQAVITATDCICKSLSLPCPKLEDRAHTHTRTHTGIRRVHHDSRTHSTHTLIIIFSSSLVCSDLMSSLCLFWGFGGRQFSAEGCVFEQNAEPSFSVCPLCFLHLLTNDSQCCACVRGGRERVCEREGGREKGMNLRRRGTFIW